MYQIIDLRTVIDDRFFAKKLFSYVRVHFITVEKHATINTLNIKILFIIAFYPELLCCSDFNQSSKFERLYGDLYIGKNPTPNHNKYLVIHLNFAVIDAELGNYRSSMDAHCNTAFNFFCDVYEQYLPKGIKEGMNKKNGCVEQLDYLYKEAVKTGARIYLFIDEYDHFTNNILSDASPLEEYKQETHGTGYLRTFFDTIKAGTYSSIERVFVTGVSPVTRNELL